MKNFIIFSIYLLFSLSACNSGNIVATTSNQVNNVAEIVIDKGPDSLPESRATTNILYTTIRVCSPGSITNCLSIDHVLLDTGSTGLRIINSNAIDALRLPRMLYNESLVNECTSFPRGYVWGSINYADVYWAHEIAPKITLQIIANTTAPVPSSCLDFSPPNPIHTVSELRANAIMGIGNMVYDKESDVLGIESSGAGYYSCSNNSCSHINIPDTSQVSNIIAQFKDKTVTNGYLIQLPEVLESYTDILKGQIVFGLNTKSNNQISTQAKIFRAMPLGYITTIYANQVKFGLFDSGTNSIKVTSNTDPVIPVIHGELFPSTPIMLTAQLADFAFAEPFYNLSDVNFMLISNQQVKPVLPYVGTYGGFSEFLWGIPFFIGKNVYFGINKATVNNESTPFVGYSSYYP